MKILELIVRMTPLSGYRRNIGLACVILSGLVTTLTSPELLGACVGATGAFCGFLDHIQTPLLALGGYLVAVGHLFRTTGK